MRGTIAKQRNRRRQTTGKSSNKRVMKVNKKRIFRRSYNVPVRREQFVTEREIIDRIPAYDL